MNADGWKALTDACRALVENQVARGDALLDSTAKEAQGEALAVIREFVESNEKPASSVIINDRLLNAAESILTADPDDAGELRDQLRELREALDPSDKRMPITLGSAGGDWPAPFLSVASDDEFNERDGAVLSAGTVAVLAGAGGSAKSTFALQLAVTSASIPDNAHSVVCGTALVTRGARTLMVLYEDSPQVTNARAKKLLAEMGRERYGDADHRVHLLDMSGRPLYGATDSLRAEPMSGWWDLWSAVDQTQSKFIIIDPILAAYVGESNSAGPVREFLSALTEKAAERKAAVLIIAHSTKAARYGGDPYDPGQIGGSGHWSDGVRGSMSLTREQRDDGFDLRLAVIKSNYGPSYLSNVLHPITPPDSNMIIGLRGDSFGWKFAGAEQANGARNGTHANL